MKAVLVLEDGKIFFGNGFGALAKRSGELVFNTSMTGYQEALTDPSYGGQILLMTYPLMGNYGTNPADPESNSIHAHGFAVRELSPDGQHRQMDSTLDSFLKKHGTPGISGIDTRQIVRHIRNRGVMPAILATYENEIDLDSLKEEAGKFDYSGYDYVKDAGVKKPEVHGKGKRIALIDYGAKMGIVRELARRGCEVHILPATSSAEDVLALEPEGIMLSNGPGDPAVPKYAHETIRKLVGKKPTFAICLGHQMIAHAFGGSTMKLKFGHRGCNHAVEDLRSGKVCITTQNHGFAVDKIPEGFELTHINVNDRTVEGMRNDDKQVFSVQYHPEACPGPHDSKCLFDEFMKMIK